MVEIMVSGLFPRSNELIREIKRFELGKLKVAELRDVLKRERESFIEYQKRLKIKIVSEPNYNFHDLMRPFTNILKNVEPGTLTRYFETNTFYRKPVITGKMVLEDLDPKTVKDYNLPGPYYFKNTKITVPSPNYFYLLSTHNDYEQHEFMADYIEILNEIIKDVKPTYVEMVECPYPSTFSDYEQLLKTIKSPEKIIVRKAQEYLNPDGILYKEQSFYAYPGKHENGVYQSIDTMNTKLDSFATVPEGVITGNENFDFLPREIAVKKLELMARLEVKA